MLIRDYDDGDHASCRALHEELVGHHREIYDAPHIGGDDPGSGFDDYLAMPDRVATWVAVDDRDAVCGLTGLLFSDGEAEVEPVVVTRSRRGEGIGRLLIERAVEEARRRGARDLNIRPVARNESAIAAFHELGFRTLGHVQMFMRLDDDSGRWQDGIDLHGHDFRF